MLRLKRTFWRHANIGRLLLGQLGQLRAHAIKVQRSHFLVQMLRQDIDFVLVLIATQEQLDLRQNLVGEGG